MYKELTYEEALEFYNRWGRTILIGSSTSDYYSFNKVKDKKSLDDCIKQYLNYHDGPVHFFLDQRTADRDREIRDKNESKNMNKMVVRLSESQLHRIIKESVNNVLEGKKKKDPMSQWFKDMDNIQKYRDDMEYITKGGRKPKHWKEKQVQESRGDKKGELEDAILNVLGILRSYNLEDFGCLDKEEFDNLHEVLTNTFQKINASYDYGPYEGEPYFFGH